MFAGIIVRDSRADPRVFADQNALLSVLTPFGQADDTGSWHGPGTMMVQALTWNSAESKHEKIPEICTETGRLIVGWMRLDNRIELCAQLGLELRPELNDPQVVLAAHRAWGEACANRLEGDFSFLIYDPETHVAFCARDTLGVRPFFYHLSRELFIFSSTAAIYPALHSFDASPSREWIARFLIGEAADPVKTAFAQVRKLPPAHSLIVGREGAAEPARYFGFSDTAPRIYRRENRWVETYREAFHRAVDVRLRSAYPLGAENSGGLDSATIIGHAVARLPGGGADLAGFSLCHLDREPGQILDLAMHCGLRQNFVLTRPSYQPSRAESARAIRVIGYPPEHNHALFHTPFLEQCQVSGIRTLLSGFGGDEMVTSQAEFLSRELLLAGRHTQVFGELPGNPVMRAARLGATIVRRMAEKRKHADHRPTPRLTRSIVRRDVIESFDLRGFRTAETLAFGQARTLNEHLLARPAFQTALTGRLEGCALMANSYRIEYRWPMLDRSLIAQYLATPSIEKRHRKWGRYLHRRACIGTVPDTILWKATKNLGGISQFGRDRQRVIVDIPGLPSLLRDIIDPGAVSQQVSTLEQAFREDDSWLASAPERNNLRALSALTMWLNSN